MIITLSPSKGQDFETPASTTAFTLPQQLDQSKILIKAAKPNDVAAIRALMKVSENIGQLTVDRFQQFKTPFTLENAKQALFAFKGDVYSAIDVKSYSDNDLDFAQAHVRMLSGLYGYLRPLDLIQAYRLEMKTKLKNPRAENLYGFWDQRITDLLNQDLAQQSEPILINLASNEYFKSIKLKNLEGKVLNINFKESKNGQTRVIAIFAKRARGSMTNWIIHNKIDSSESLKSFDVDGYSFNSSLSDEKQWTFSRRQPKAQKPN
jgi:cytoplasmic iron level regulating protein YaaA (DUF328/UPF0246 family)